jgi:hypothetical protein
VKPGDLVRIKDMDLEPDLHGLVLSGPTMVYNEEVVVVDWLGWSSTESYAVEYLEIVSEA